MLRWLNILGSEQFLPSYEDVSDARLLSDMVKGKNSKETLINMVDWQHRNIKGWDDRWITYLEVTVFPLVFLFLLSSFDLFLFILLSLLGIFSSGSGISI